MDASPILETSEIQNSFLIPFLSAQATLASLTISSWIVFTSASLLTCLASSELESLSVTATFVPDRIIWSFSITLSDFLPETIDLLAFVVPLKKSPSVVCGVKDSTWNIATEYMHRTIEMKEMKRSTHPTFLPPWPLFRNCRVSLHEKSDALLATRVMLFFKWTRFEISVIWPIGVEVKYRSCNRSYQSRPISWSEDYSIFVV